MIKKENEARIDLEAINTSYSNSRTKKLLNKSFLPNTSVNSINTNNTTTDKTRPKNYESFNVVSETGDSIYSPPFEELTIAEESEGQVFISMDKMEDFVNQLIQHRLGPLFNNNKNEH